MVIDPTSGVLYCIMVFWHSVKPGDDPMAAGGPTVETSRSSQDGGFSEVN